MEYITLYDLDDCIPYPIMNDPGSVTLAAKTIARELGKLAGQQKRTGILLCFTGTSGAVMAYAVGRASRREVGYCQVPKTGEASHRQQSNSVHMNDCGENPLVVFVDDQIDTGKTLGRVADAVREEFRYYYPKRYNVEVVAVSGRAYYVEENAPDVRWIISG